MPTRRTRRLFGPRGRRSQGASLRPAKVGGWAVLDETDAAGQRGLGGDAVVVERLYVVYTIACLSGLDMVRIRSCMRLHMAHE